jgi:ubiquinone/menaquinone biosynthesis C-methylase UbiE
MEAEQADSKKMRIIRDYDATSSFYDFRYKKDQFDKMKKIFIRKRVMNSPILDFGGGTGLFLDYLVEVEEDSLFDIHPLPEIGNHYVNMDISSEMLKVMMTKPSLEMVSELLQVHAVCGDCENPPFRDKAFNSFISLTSIQNFPNPEKALRELHRITSSKAEGFVTTLNKKTTKKDYVDLISSVFNSSRIISGDFGEDFAANLKK